MLERSTHDGSAARSRASIAALPLIFLVWIHGTVGAQNVEPELRAAMVPCSRAGSKQVPEDHPDEGIDLVRFDVEGLKLEGRTVTGKGRYRGDRGFTPFTFTCVVDKDNRRARSFHYKSGSIELFPWAKVPTPGSSK